MKDEEEPIVAIGSLKLTDLALLGPTFERAYKIDETPCFGDLLRAIDEADRPAGLARP
ncbi:hypothetical protein [Sphingomonas colocasiae]|uniref:Uncharacterized protein n=1 Tax=Sphingomonas colocasiae TaxID=1848973 RepID=A0ABS7PTR0_9SPHN|nr:hypothetical protein [Sphingomonas colocasiae]MBY8823787.1 hypothetical protein [Sphingomonas colocasiae]